MLIKAQKQGNQPEEKF